MTYTFRRTCTALIGTAALASLQACTDALAPDLFPDSLSAWNEGALTAGAPTPVTTVAMGANTLTLWPFTAGDPGGTAADPVNLLFFGAADPRSLRAALLMLDGNRTAFGMPDVFPFNCTWSDAVGGVQAAWAEPVGWVGSAVQLQCGTYAPIRFHLRLFRAGNWTLGGVHFEVLIPGTTDHQVLSWELAEQLVTVDLLRSGILDGAAPLMPSPAIHPAPWRDIPAIIYNGLPVELRGAIGGPLGGVSEAVPIATDGRATMFNVAAAVDGEPGVYREVQTLQFDQVIPKPFCASGPADYLYVTGPVELRQTVTLSASGNLTSRFQAVGHLDVTPVNPFTSPPSPVGETFRAQVREHHQSVLTDGQQRARSFTLQVLVPPGNEGRGQLRLVLAVADGRLTGGVRVECR